MGDKIVANGEGGVNALVYASWFALLVCGHRQVARVVVFLSSG